MFLGEAPAPSTEHTVGGPLPGSDAGWDPGSRGSAVAHLRDWGRLFALGFPAMVMLILSAVRRECKRDFTPYVVG